MWWRPRPDPAAPPLFFFHIAKTAGTSLTAALTRHYPRARIHSARGNLPPDAVAAWIAAGLDGGDLIHGHPGHGVGRMLRARARTVTLLRDPVDQSVSAYLYVRGDPANDDHALANRLGLTDFLRARPYYAAFQTGSLLVGLHDAPVPLDAFAAHLPEVEAYLAAMTLVGVSEASEAFAAALSREMGWKPLRLGHRRRARADSATIAALRTERRALDDDPTLAPLFAIERATVAVARRLAPH